ncbi:hypothetical protein SAMN05661010_02538 [Modicisalibacter muralis]|uniref:Uncharacterized protein n=1 Tax=Modicisalibacter muralis TaxID=119000 RepID=A0A1G9MWG4_9GAMM|nr:hypothetical protein [Halomonas muralis]SDL78257.1 hypothetical protein SAMN05661010_02538 [Halomonas muralis]
MSRWALILGTGSAPLWANLFVLMPFALTWLLLVPFIGSRALKLGNAALFWLTLASVYWLWWFVSQAFIHYAMEAA